MVKKVRGISRVEEDHCSRLFRRRCSPRSPIPWLVERHRRPTSSPSSLDLGPVRRPGRDPRRARWPPAPCGRTCSTRARVRARLRAAVAQGRRAVGRRYPMATALARPLIARKLIEIARIEQTPAAWRTGRQAATASACAPVAPRSILRSTRSATCAASAARRIRAAARRVRAPGRRTIASTPTCGAARSAAAATTAPTKPPEALFKLTHAPRRTRRARQRSSSCSSSAARRSASTASRCRSTEMIESLATIAGEHGVGRLDRIKVRADGTRSRAFYEAPAAVVLHLAHAELWRFVSSGIAAALRHAGVGDRTSRRSIAANGSIRLRTGLDAYVTTRPRSR